MNYFIVSKSLDDSSLEYLGGILSSIMDLSEGKIHNLSSDSEAEIAGMKIEIRQCQPKVIISLGAEASRVLDENFKYINSSRGKLSAYNNEGFTTKMVVTYSPKFLLVSDANMEKYGPVFLQDLEYAVKYVKGELIDITKKNLQYAKTYADFKEYFDQYLKDAKLPAYDIETNAKDTRSAAFRIIGYSLAPNSDTGIYVIKESLEYKMSDEDWEKCVNLTKEYISSRKVLVHNIMYERPSTLNEWGVNITNFEDSLIKSRLLLGGKTGAGLKQQCAKNLGYPDWDTDLHVYLTCLGTLRDKLKPTPMGKVREDYAILKEQGFASLLDVYTKKVNLYTETLEKCKGLEPELISKEDKAVLEKGSLDNREGAVKEALETLAELIGNYYDNPAEILELAAKEAINLIDIQHEGIIPYSSVPMNIITKYGALDSIGTQDLNDYLDRRIEKDSTAEVDLHHGYKVLKANYLAGTEMELYGLYWNDEIAENIRVWLSEKAYEAMIAMLQSGFLDDNIFEKSRPHLLQYVKEKEQDKIREILGEFDVMKSGIKLKASGKRITWNQLLDQLGESFIQSHYQQIVDFVKSDLRNKESYPNYEAFTELFNPASNAILGTLQRIFMSVELKVANALNEIINVIKAGLELESLPNSDRIIYECYLDKINYNNKIDSGEIEGTKIPAKVIFESMSEVIKQRIISQSQKQSFNRRGKWGRFADKGNSLDKILEDACLKYEIKDTSEPTIVSIYNNLTVMGCDIEDESTWTEQFRFLVNFRTFKKCIKLINVYIDGDKIGRGSVWVVNKQDILERDKKFAPRKQKYVPDIKEDETYLMQATWGVCFTGDTKIKCLDGISRSFKEIVSQDTKTLWVYAVTPSGTQIPAQATDIRLTRKNAKLVEVELDSNAKIRCTPDHLFMLRNGQYKKAESLTPADELMSVRSGIAIQKFVSHRAVSVVPLDYTEDVYDLTVIGYSNFALDCGVFVHNCTAATLRWRGGVHCLHPDTQILLTDNRSIPVKELYKEFISGKNNYVYSRSEVNCRLVIELIRDVYISGKFSDMVRVYLDNGKSFEVTPDHKMVMRDGSYEEAQYLKEGDSLYPIDIHMDKTNHNFIYDPDLNKNIPCHYLSDDFNERHGLLRDMSKDFMGRNGAWIRHHVDFNPLNNNPENVHRYGRNTHDIIHKSSEGRKKMWERIKYRMSTDPEYYEKKITQMRKNGYYQFVLSENARKYRQLGGLRHCLKFNSDPEYKIKCMRGQILNSLNKLSALEEVTPESYNTLRQKHSKNFMLFTPKVILKYFESLDEAINLSKSYNHKIVKVEKIHYDIPIEVYSVAIHADSPSYSLDCGVMSKNTLPAGPMIKGIYTSRYKGGVIAAPDYCLTGDTEVLLLDNTKKCLSELEGVEEFFVYSYDEKTKKVVVGRGHDCRIVRTVDETVKLTFDDNSSIECSADHTFMKLSEQKFIKAEDLSVGDTIQTLQLGRCEGNFRRTKDNKVLVVGKGRLEVENLDGSKILVQALANDWNLANSIYSSCDKPMHIHHTDGNPDNNDPRNLAYITGSQHNRNHAKEQWSNTERLYNGQTFREKMTEVATKVFAPLRLGINKNPVNIEKRRQGNLKVHEARFAQGLEVMLQHYSAEALAIRFNHGAEYDSELRMLLGVTRLPKGMGYRTLNSLKTTFIDYLGNLTDNPITKKNLSLIREIRAKLPVNGVSGQDLFKAIIDHNLILERFEDSRQYLVQNNLLPSNNHVTLSYVEKAFGSIENFYLWHTYFADTYITGYRSQNPLKVMLSSNTEGQITEAKVYDHKFAYSRLSYRVYFTDNEFLEVAPGQRIRTASGVYKYPEELGGYSVMSHYLKETENNTVKVAKYDPSLSRAVVKIEKVFYPASVEFERFSIDKDHNYLVPVYTDKDANNLNVVLHNDSQHRYIIKIERLKYDTPKELYCFTVDHYHNFFTGQGILTHQSQQEIRTISGLANCQSLLEAYRNGEDVHMKTAMSVFKKPADQITKNERRFCKSATFAILYGSTVPGLANLMSVPIEQAQQMMDGFFNAYPELKVWMDARHSEIDRGKKVSCSKVGYFLDIDSNGYGGIEEAYKQAGNYPVQGQSSLIAGYVLNSINQYFVDNHMMTKPISFIHDSLEFDIHPSELFIACQKITSMMNDIPNAEFGIPSKAELTIGMSMGDENEVTYLEEQEGGGIIELQGYEDDLDAILKNWRNVYSSVDYTDDPDSIEEVYVPRKEIFMPKLTISKYSGTIRKMVKRRFVIKF